MNKFHVEIETVNEVDADCLLQLLTKAIQTELALTNLYGLGSNCLEIVQVDTYSLGDTNES